LTGRRGFIAILVVAILAVALLAAIYLSRTGGRAATTPISNATTSATTGLTPVGAVLYLWYGNATRGTGGLGSPGWNSPTCPGGGAVVDTPSAGFYVSDSNATFRRQVGEMQNAGISFALVSWWGPFTTGEAGAINKATLDLFRYLASVDSSFKVAVMIDAFTTACNLPDITTSQVCGYVQNTFAAPYSRWYLRWEAKPLLLFFNPLQPCSNDNFTMRTIGNRPNSVDWIFWDAPANFSQGQGGTGVNMSNDVGDPFVSPDGEVTVVPRIDSYFNYVGGYQPGFLRFDSGLQLGLYQYEWNFVLSHRNEVRLVLIYSWNEYHERTAIEPHVNGNSTLPEDYLLNVTARYVGILDPPGG